MAFSETQIRAAKLFDIASHIYKDHYLSNGIFEEQFHEGYKALVCFLKNYAYARQGVLAAYSVIALQCVSKTYQDGNNWSDWSDPTEVQAEKIWDDYKKIAKDNFNLWDTKKNKLKVNEVRNPLRKEKGVIASLASIKVPNIAVYVRDSIKNSNTDGAYRFLRSICGIGDKIASFYMRDIGYLDKLNEQNITNLHLLQPIDTWLDQTLDILFNHKSYRTLEEKQKNIVNLCQEAGVSSISFNQGAWLFGSQIARDFNTFNKAVDTRSFVLEIFEKHIEEKEQYLRRVKKALRCLRQAGK